MAKLEDQIAEFPGGDLVSEGLRDLEAGRETVPACAVGMAADRLRSAGLPIPDSGTDRPARRLYDLFAAEDADSAHGRYNAVVRQMVSFVRASEHARRR
jgi:hypothetical protein